MCCCRCGEGWRPFVLSVFVSVRFIFSKFSAYCSIVEYPRFFAQLSNASFMKYGSGYSYLQQDGWHIQHTLTVLSFLVFVWRCTQTQWERLFCFPSGSLHLHHLTLWSPRLPFPLWCQRFEHGDLGALGLWTLGRKRALDAQLASSDQTKRGLSPSKFSGSVFGDEADNMLPRDAVIIIWCHDMSPKLAVYIACLFLVVLRTACSVRWKLML